MTSKHLDEKLHVQALTAFSSLWFSKVHPHHCNAFSYHKAFFFIQFSVSSTLKKNLETRIKTGFNSSIDKRIVFKTLQFLCGHMETKAFGIKLYRFPNKNTMARTIEIKKKMQM